MAFGDSIFKDKVQFVESALVDGTPWYTIKVLPKECADYIRNSDTNLWYEHRGYLITRFDVHEQLYTLIMIGWSN